MNGSIHQFRSRPRESAFTLLELVLVMVIIAIAFAMAAPKLVGFSRGRELRGSADAFISTTRYARSQAATNGQIYRLTIDPRAGSYQLAKQQGQDFVALTGDFGDARTVPDGYRIEVMSQTGPTSNAIDFYPSGRTQPAQVRITDKDGATIDINCPSAAEDFAIVTSVNQ